MVFRYHIIITSVKQSIYWNITKPINYISKFRHFFCLLIKIVIWHWYYHLAQAQMLVICMSNDLSTLRSKSSTYITYVLFLSQCRFFLSTHPYVVVFLSQCIFFPYYWYYLSYFVTVYEHDHCSKCNIIVAKFLLSRI